MAGPCACVSKHCLISNEIPFRRCYNFCAAARPDYRIMLFLALGLWSNTEIDWLEAKWPQPSSSKQRFTNLPIDRYITNVEGREKWK